MRPEAGMWTIFFIFVELGCARDDTCNVTQEGEITRYSVPAFKGNNCVYGWSNSSEHVLANHLDHMEDLVLMNSNRSLLLKGCSDTLIYRLQCVPEGIEKNFKCKTSCSHNANPHSAAGTLRKHWAAVISVCLVCFSL